MKSVVTVFIIVISCLTSLACSPPEPTGTYQASVSGRPYTVTFLAGRTARLVSPANGQTFTGTYTIDGKTIVIDFGFGKEVFQVVNSETLRTEWQGSSVELNKR
jgi:hypothetical protein